MNICPARRLCHLPLVMDVLRRTGVLGVIDHACGQHILSEVSTGECVAILLSGVFVGAHSLWRIRERLSPYDMATVMQDATFDLDRFPEERLAKALDDLYEHGLDKMMTGIALQAIASYDLDCDFLHFDTTTLSFYGAHEKEDPWSSVDGIPPPPKVTYGYSKAKRPDLKQVLFGNLCTGDGGVPLLGKVLDGNMSDNVAAAEFFSKVRELVAHPQDVCLVADSKGWCYETLSLVRNRGLRLLSRLPRSTRLHADLMSVPWEPDLCIERPPARRGQATERYEIMGFDCSQVLRPSIKRSRDNDGGEAKDTLEIPVRAIRVYSSALLHRKMERLERLVESESRKALKKIRDWENIVYACELDAKRAAERHQRQHQAITHDLMVNVIRQDGLPQRRRGRPRKRPEPKLVAGVHWRIQYTIEPVVSSESAQRLHDQASFILIRTRDAQWDISDLEMIERYHGQYHVEHGFSWLKSGAEINPMFIHTPRRIAAMGFIYCLGLMTWNLIQRTVRKHLRDTQTGLPYHRGKPSDNITTRFLFELFPMVQTVVVTDDQGRKDKHTLGLDRWQRKAAQALGTPESAFKPVMEIVR